MLEKVHEKWDNYFSKSTYSTDSLTSIKLFNGKQHEI